MKTPLSVLFLVVSLASAGNALARDAVLRDPVVTDPVPDAQHPTANKQLLVPSHGVGMNALFLLASSAGPKPTLVLLHGLPGNERNLDLAQAVRRAGWNVLTFTYRGAWGSPGKFSMANAIEDASAAVAFLHQPEVAAKYHVDTRRIVLGGHSMGGLAAAEHAATHDDIAALLLIDPWNPVVDAIPVRADPGKHAELVAGIDDLGNSLAGADAESLAREVEHSPAKWDLPALAPKLATRRVMLVWADRGLAEQNATFARALEKAGAKQLTATHMPTDHAFSDHRIALSRAVVAWLDAQEDAHARVIKVLATTPLVDGHNDLVRHYHSCKECPRGLDAYDIGGSVPGHTDLARWKAGRVGAQVINAGYLGTDTTLAGTLKGLDFVRSMASRWPNDLVVARTSAEVRAAHESGRLALILALEHPDRIGTDESTVKQLAAAGLRSEILAYDEPTALADGHFGPPTHGGLSPLGVRMVGWMQDAGILVDLSHSSAETARDVLDIARAPVIFSHSNAAAITNVSRNVPDDVLRRLQSNGGLVMVSFAPEFNSKAFDDWWNAGDAEWHRLLEANAGKKEVAGPLMDAWEKANQKPVVTIAQVADHIEHVRDVAGIDHVGLGSDFDGIDDTVAGLEDVSKFPALLEELARRGWGDEELAKVAGANFLRVLDAADAFKESARDGHSAVAP
jgi:microsomal dipeptidase-like Zn-dependent dipeptidase/pimeloyl-ACP methyl ester carboxylesterase